ARDAGIGGRVVDQLTSGSSLWTGRRLEPLAEGQAAALLGIQGVSRSAMDCGFRSFATGMADLVEALVARVGPAIRPAQGVTGLAPATRGWRLSLGGGSTLEAEAVILALPAWVAARLVAAAGVPVARRPPMRNSPASWESRDSRCGVARSRGRGVCRATSRATPGTWPRCANVWPGCHRWRSQARGSMGRECRRALSREERLRGR